MPAIDSHNDNAAPPRCAVLAAAPDERACALARAHGLEPALVLAKGDLTASPARLRERVRAARVDLAAICSEDWARQLNPQLYLTALAVLPVASRLIVDAGGAVPTSRSRVAARIATIPMQLAGAAAATAAEAARSVRGPASATRRRIEQPAVLAVWIADPVNPVGGSITHISGILAGLRDAGMRTALLTTRVPPAQLEAVVDDFEVIPPAPAGARVTGDVEAVARNRLIRSAGAQLARRASPGFVYQRHAPFLGGGLNVANALDIPFVLEWNSSEVWIRQHWEAPMRIERLLDPLLERLERKVAGAADLVVAVSEGAADMALGAGAPPERLLVAPNAVDIDELDRCTAGASPRPGTSLVGWIGTFGSWHGPEVLVEALAALADARLLMIGDGPLRGRCEELARELGVDTRIEWAGRLAHAEAVRRLAECDVLASPHVPTRDRPFFGSPTKIFEYMALGRPIVASRLEQIGEVLEDGRTARLVPPGDVPALASAIRAVLESPDRGAALGRAARDEAERNHTWRSRADEIIERIGGVAGGRPEPRPERAVA